MDDSVPSRSITIYGIAGVQTDLDLNTLGDQEVADVIPDLLVDYAAECKDWTQIAAEHWRQQRWDKAQELLARAVAHFMGGTGRPPDPVALMRVHTMLAHLHLALARSAPRAVLPHTKYDKLDPSLRTKDFYYTEATVNLNKADEAHRASGGGEEEPTALALGKILLYLARGQPGVAHPLVDKLLARQRSNIIGLLAQARLQFARRAHDAAFETYQRLLALKPDMSPDPRIGLGFCAWVTGDKVRAKLAWERALKRDPTAWAVLLLLGLASLNTARDPKISRADRLAAEAEGVTYVQRAFKLNTNSPASAIALASVTGQQSGKIAVASKLAERAIQYADNKRHTVLANAERGRLGFVAGDVADAGPFISAAKTDEGGGVNVMAELTLGQIAIQNGNFREALNFIEQTAKRLNGAGPLEYTVLHASLLNYPHPGMTPDELARNRQTARTMLSDLHKQFSELRAREDVSPDEAETRLRIVGQDPDIFIDLGRMWMEESLDKAATAYQAAVAISVDMQTEDDEGKVDLRAVKMSANLGALYQLQGNVETAERMYQDALGRVAGEKGEEAEKMRTVLAFNLGRAYEEEGDVGRASQWYRDVLRQHPEHMESKIRLASIAAQQGRNVDAHTLLKECLKSDENALVLRSTYTHFLISLGSYKEALAFTTQTLRLERNDVYTFCALGWLHFALGREARTAPELAERSKQYLRSGEAYERALSLDPNCAMAAQGLAVALAEDALALKPAHGQTLAPPDELRVKQRAAGLALGVLGRINDSLPDGSTSVNMGHCYFVRGDEEKAIQAYEAAENYFKGRNVPNLLYLSRTWYAYANRDSNYSAMGKALWYAQRAMHILPSDRAILYNIAMIQQKAAEMLLSLEPSKRTLQELQAAMVQAQHAVHTFRELAADKTKPLPYDVDLADQRARYGDGLLRKAPEQIERQELYEGEHAARVEEARKVRAAEEAKIRAAEEERRAELAKRAAEIARNREELAARQREFQEELDRERAQDAAEREERGQRVAERKRRKEAGEDVDEDKPRRKRGTGGAAKGGKKGRNVRSRSEISTDSAVSSRGVGGAGAGDVSGEEGEPLDPEQERKRGLERMKAAREKKKKASKRAAVADPDEDDGGARGGRKGNGKFKSKAVIEDSDEDARSDAEAVGPNSEAGEEAEAAPTGSRRVRVGVPLSEESESETGGENGGGEGASADAVETTEEDGLVGGTAVPSGADSGPVTPVAGEVNGGVSGLDEKANGGSDGGAQDQAVDERMQVDE